MKKANSLLLIMFITFQVQYAQTKSKVENYPLKAMDLVLYSFGMDYPITIGTISDTGELNFKFQVDLTLISEEIKANFISDVKYEFFSKCNNSYDILSEDENVKAINAGYISLSTRNNPYSGLLFMVTDENMVPWLESYASIDAVLGSYFELVFVESDFNYQGECTSTVTNTESDTIETIYIYNLQLKAGFNFIEYKIESTIDHQVPSMYEENVFEKIAKPDSISVSSSQTIIPNTKWIGKYF
jgi:hypothetical protein